MIIARSPSGAEGRTFHKVPKVGGFSPAKNRRKKPPLGPRRPSYRIRNPLRADCVYGSPPASVGVSTKGRIQPAAMTQSPAEFARPPWRAHITAVSAERYSTAVRWNEHQKSGGLFSANASCVYNAPHCKFTKARGLPNLEWRT